MIISDELLHDAHSFVAALRGPELARQHYGNPDASKADDLLNMFEWADVCVDDTDLVTIVSELDAAIAVGFNGAARVALFAALRLIDNYMCMVYRPTLLDCAKARIQVIL